MHIKKGIAASPGICIAKSFLLDTEAYLVAKHRCIRQEDIHRKYAERSKR